MEFVNCPFNKQLHCPQDNRVCRHCTPGVPIRAKIIIALIIGLFFLIMAAGCVEEYKSCGTVESASIQSYVVAFRPSDNMGQTIRLHIRTDRIDTVRVGSRLCLQLANQHINKSANQQ